MRMLFYQDRQAGLLGNVCASEPGGSLMLESLSKATSLSSFGEVLHLLPESWVQKNPALEKSNLHIYSDSYWRIPDLYKTKSYPEGVLLLKGNTFCSIKDEQIEPLIHSTSHDILCINVNEQLLAGKEAIRVTPSNHIVGFRRYYQAETEPTAIPSDWPDIVYFNERAWKALCKQGKMLLHFQGFLEEIDSMDFSVASFKIGGRVLNFQKEQPLLAFLEEFLPDSIDHIARRYPQVRTVGKVCIGQHVKIGSDTLLLGPVVISDHAQIGKHSTIRRAYITDHCVIADHQILNQCVVLRGHETHTSAQTDPLWCVEDFFEKPSQPDFKGWPFYSYARFGKRIFDILFSAVILILLLPIFVVIPALIKLTSPGPIFYKARRQGRHGKEFGCLKFRTMMVQADAMQERLRAVNQVDGPQFKMEHDPRISGLGKFLRDTCIDELPQFLNVLFGQMSVVGPRPSPANENESSPAWRDARLSVRPGITGLWQISRTRQASMDFQEWVHYDTEYVRKLSFRHDLSICFRTAKMLISTFLDQFG